MDAAPNQGAGSGTPETGGIGKYLKRFRSAIKPSTSNKASRQNSSDVLEQTSGGRHLESAASWTTTFRTRTPEQRSRTPETRSPSSLGRSTPSLRIPTPDVPDVPPIPETIPPVPRDPRARPPSRPLMTEPSISEGNLIARPIQDKSEEPLHKEPLHKEPLHKEPIHKESLHKEPDAHLERSNSNIFPRSDPRDQRSIDLFKRYGMELEEGDWAPRNRPATMERVDKAIRMRVHYHCHRCELAIGPSKVCISCGHRRCKKCVKVPVRRRHRDNEDDDVTIRNPTPTPDLMQYREPSPKQSIDTQTSWYSSSSVGDMDKKIIIGSNASTTTHESEVSSIVESPFEDSYGPNWPLPATPLPPPPPPPLPAARKKTSTRRLTQLLQDIQAAHYHPTDAIHVSRLCHCCGTAFIRCERTCHNCEHQQCNRCPRDPPPPTPSGRQSRTPTPTSGLTLPSRDAAPRRRERMWKTPRRRVKWTCDHCQSLFSEKEKTCSSCGHDRCKTCVREPPATKIQTPTQHAISDPSVFKTIETRLATFAIIDSGAASKTLATLTIPRTPPSRKSPSRKSPSPLTLPPVPTHTLARTHKFRATSPMVDGRGRPLAPAEWILPEI